MKVLYLIDSLGYGGAERLLVDLVIRMKERGVDVVVVSMTNRIPLVQHLNTMDIPVTTLAFDGTIYSARQMWQAAAKLRTIIQSERVQIVHSHLYTSDILARISAPLSCKLINTIHSRDPWWYERKRLRSVGRTMLDSISHRARGVRSIAVSEDAANEAISRLRINASAVRVIFNGINMNAFVARRDRRALSTIIQVARFYPVKGHRTALLAFANLLVDNPDLQLVWCGGGPEEESLRREAKRLGIDRSVRFLGFRSDVAEQLAQADIFWMPSKWEGMPIACIEAMAMELPIVASNVGGIPELVVDRVTGLLIEPDSPVLLAEATRILLHDPGRARALGSASRVRAQQCFSIDATVDSYIQAYRDMLDSAW